MHPELATLLAYHDGELGTLEGGRVSHHLEHCAECRMKSELGKWQPNRLAACQEYSPTGGDSAGRRADLLSKVRALRSSYLPLTPSLVALLVGRKAAANGGERPGESRRWKLQIIAILAAILLHMLLGVVCWCGYQLTGNVWWVQIFKSAANLFLFELGGVALYLNWRVWKGFEPNEPLQLGWFLITVSSVCGLAGTVFAKLLATQGNPSWTELHQFGTFLDGPLRMLLLLGGFCSILRAYHRAGIVRTRFSGAGWILVISIATYTLCEGVQITLGFVLGRLSTLLDMLNATNDPLLVMLLIVVLILRRSVRNLGSEFVENSWGAFLGTIGLVAIGDMVAWALHYGYLNGHMAPAAWGLWFLSAAGYVAAAAYQLEGMGRTVDVVAARKPSDAPAATQATQ
jgi:hypothetical protein